MISLPAVLHLAGVAQSSARDELRELAERPRFPTSTGAWRAFSARLDAYLADRFGLKPELVSAARHLSFTFRLPLVQSVIVGKDGWLYWGGHQELEQHAGLRLLSRAEIDRWIDTLRHYHDWLAARGIRFVFVLAPDKSEIYPEHLPDGIPASPVTPADQLLSALAKQGVIDAVDLRPVMRQAKSRGTLYYKFDSHWKPAAAYIGLKKVLEGRWPIPLPPLSDYRLDPKPLGGDLARLAGLECCVSEPSEDLLRTFPDPVVSRTGSGDPLQVGYRIVTRHKDYPSIFLCNDSFGDRWSVPLADVAYRIVFRRNDRPCKASAVEAEKPDLFIFEAVQRLLSEPPQPLALE
ncbi:MAG TPA: hypothetical protein VFA23_05870 [Dongiaceae bacterium]|nr:hypothetical protein [Dongiaceae bacterium]